MSTANNASHCPQHSRSANWLDRLVRWLRCAWQHDWLYDHPDCDRGRVCRRCDRNEVFTGVAIDRQGILMEWREIIRRKPPNHRL